MGGELFFHPYDIMPGTQLETCGVKMSHCPVTEFFMESDTDRVRVGDAGAKVTDVLPAEQIFQLTVQRSTHATALCLAAKID